MGGAAAPVCYSRPVGPSTAIILSQSAIRRKKHTARQAVASIVHRTIVNRAVPTLL